MTSAQPVSAGRIAGILPQPDGACALLEPNGALVRTLPMPFVEQAARTVVDGRGLVKILRAEGVDLVVIGRAILSREPAYRRAFALGISVGIAEGAVAVAGFQFGSLNRLEWTTFLLQWPPGLSHTQLAAIVWPTAPTFPSEAHAQASLAALAGMQAAEKRRLAWSGSQTALNAAWAA